MEIQMKRPTLCLLAITLLAACGKDTPVTSVDLTAPTVSSTAPVNAGLNVPRNPSVTATFSEAMNPTTINATTFVLMSGVTPVTGVVTMVGNTATLVPTVALAANASFTATISTGAKDVAGNALAAAKHWTFTTVATSATGPA